MCVLASGVDFKSKTFVGDDRLWSVGRVDSFKSLPTTNFWQFGVVQMYVKRELEVPMTTINNNRCMLPSQFIQLPILKMVEDTGRNATIKPGSVVKLTGLRTAALNGSLGVVKRFNTGSGRYHVVKSQGTNACVGVKPENITQDSIVQPSDPEFTKSRLYQHVVFWPRPNGVDSIPVHSFTDWPGRGQSKVEYLRRQLGYTDPQRFTGVKGPGSAKPDFILYFDAADETSPINHTALSIKRNLPSFEIIKVPRDVQNKVRYPAALAS